MAGTGALGMLPWWCRTVISITFEWFLECAGGVDYSCLPSFCFDFLDIFMHSHAGTYTAEVLGEDSQGVSRLQHGGVL